MSRNDVPMLFLPPRPPLALAPDAVVVIGRSRSCELRLPSGDASRRHAEIVPSGSGFLLRDLGSTNGTHVNGSLVQHHLLEPGDRIEIAGSTITFCQVARDRASSAADLSDAKTLLEDRSAETETFAGELSEVPAFAVLQTLEMARNSGVLRIDSPQAVGRLWLADGQPVHAETKGQKGFDAALSLVNAEQGRFTFLRSAQAPEITIEASVTELLLEASRALDESLA
jgi:pSer/pThr/pTyr-binding forkhead associated (FHA) protein